MDQDMTGASATPAPEPEKQTQQLQPMQQMQQQQITPQQEALLNLARLAHLAVDLLLEKSQA